MYKMSEISQEKIEDESPKSRKDRETLRERLKKRKYPKTRKIEQKLWIKKNKAKEKKAKEKKVKKKGEQYISYMY